MVPHVDSLPNDVELLKKNVVHLATECDLLREQLRLLKAKLFGRKSERLEGRWDGYAVEQLLLFDFTELDELAPASAESDGTDEQPTTKVQPYERRKPKRQPLPAYLPRVPIRHDIPEAERVCGCGTVKQEISAETSEQLDMVRPELRVLQHIRPKYACQKCQGTHSDGAPPVVIAAPAPHILPKSMASPGLLAHVMASKFVDGLPFYRQEAQLLRMGVHIGRATMCGWALKIAEACNALPELLWEHLRAGPLLQYDESTIQVLDERGRSPSTKSYMWAALGGAGDRRAVVFEYSETRSSETPRRRLAGYCGGVQTDDYGGYDFLDDIEGVIHYACFAHVRRKFTDVLKAAGAQPSQAKGTLAEQALDHIRALYHVESAAVNAKLTGGGLVAWRHKHAKPVLQRFSEWLSVWVGKVPPRNLLGKAIAYTMGLWPRLERYIDNAVVTLDNNLIENAFRPYVVGRKSWLFAATPAGARATALFYTLAETAKLNGVEPYSYLRCLFDLLPKARSDDDRRSLLPMHIEPTLVRPYIRPPRRCETFARIARPGLLLPARNVLSAEVV